MARSFVAHARLRAASALVSALVFFTLAAGLALPFPVAAASRHSSSAAREYTPRTDAQIEATLHAKLAKSKIGKDGFRFRVERGVVTWEGVTHVAQHKGAATRMAKSSGAVRVVNNILVATGGKAKPGAPIPKAQVER